MSELAEIMKACLHGKCCLIDNVLVQEEVGLRGKVSSKPQNCN